MMLQELKVIDGGLAKPKPKMEAWEIHWQWCKPLIETCLKYQEEYCIMDIYEGIATGKLMLWPHPNQQSCIVTELVDFPQYRAMNLLFLAGNMSDCEDILEAVTTFARIAECKKIFGGGRKGWQRYAKRHGFKQEHIISKTL